MDDCHLYSLDLLGLTSEINYNCNVVTLGSNGTHQAEITSDHMSASSYGFRVKLIWSPRGLVGHEGPWEAVSYGKFLRSCTIATVRHKGTPYPVATHLESWPDSEYRGDERNHKSPGRFDTMTLVANSALAFTCSRSFMIVVFHLATEKGRKIKGIYMRFEEDPPEN